MDNSERQIRQRAQEIERRGQREKGNEKKGEGRIELGFEIDKDARRKRKMRVKAKEA